MKSPEAHPDGDHASGPLVLGHVSDDGSSFVETNSVLNRIVAVLDRIGDLRQPLIECSHL